MDVDVGLGLPLRASSLAAGVFIFSFYHVTNYALQLAFYARALPPPGAPPPSWRTQPRRRAELLGAAAAAAPWGPACGACGCGGRKPGRPLWHAALALVNTALAACFAAATAEGFSSGRTAMSAWGAGGAPFAGGRSLPAGAALLALQAAGGFLAAFAAQTVLEYFWHRAMHTPGLYGALHKLHHLNTSPTPFDDMLIHPLEAAGYFCILYGPAWALPIGLPAFALYMAALGLAGVADHAGVRLRAGPYDAAEHDLHHEKFNVNFGFPLMVMDRLCGTYAAPAPGARGAAAPPARATGAAGAAGAVVDVDTAARGRPEGGRPPPRAGRRGASTLLARAPRGAHAEK